jgi:hypothetical protein
MPGKLLESIGGSLLESAEESDAATRPTRHFRRDSTLTAECLRTAVVMVFGYFLESGSKPANVHFYVVRCSNDAGPERRTFPFFFRLKLSYRCFARPNVDEGAARCRLVPERVLAVPASIVQNDQADQECPPDAVSAKRAAIGRLCGVSGNLRRVRVGKIPSGPRLKFEHPNSEAKTQATPRRPRACSPSCCGRSTDAR